MNAMIAKSSACISMAMLALASTGCGAFLGGGYPVGFIYDASSKPHPMDQAPQTGPGKSDDKMGEACSTGFVGAVAIGDASIAAAKKAGGITDVHSVDLRTFSILGVYTQGCTVVHGK
jgi:hypothetical protein